MLIFVHGADVPYFCAPPDNYYYGYSMQFLSKAGQHSLRELLTKKGRDEQGLFMAEGLKLCTELPHTSLQTECLVLREKPAAAVLELAEQYESAGIPVYYTGPAAFARLCDTQSPQGILAIVRKPRAISPPLDQNFILLDGIADPGNTGTIIRTAEWFGVQHIILSPGCADPLGPKALRASMGSALRLNILPLQQDTAAFLCNYKNRSDFALYGLSLQGAMPLPAITTAGKAWGLILGSESHGISAKVLSMLTHHVLIPGIGQAESLNAGIAAGIALYHLQIAGSQA